MIDNVPISDLTDTVNKERLFNNEVFKKFRESIEYR